MNIHFNDIKIFEELKKITIFSTVIGSHMYGTADISSDIDILYIYIPSYEEMNSMAYNQHQFQYKSNNVDHIFIDIFNFLKNSLNGDSTINFEILNYPYLKKSKLEFLYNMRKCFYNHKIIRSYLGLARRDLKYLSKVDTDREKNKKLNHILRGYTFCLNILNSDFNPIIDHNSDLYKQIIENKKITDYKKRFEISQMLSEKITDTRNEINKKLDNNTLGFPQYINDKDLFELDKKLSENIFIWRKELKESDYYSKLKDIIYDSVANGIKYDNM